MYWEFIQPISVWQGRLYTGPCANFKVYPLIDINMVEATEKKQSSFAADFLMAGVSAAVSKTAAAPIERIKLLLQNQDEMIKQGRLKSQYKGIGDCCIRTVKTEGVVSLWNGNLANVLRYFPTQALNFAFKDKIKAAFKENKEDAFHLKLGKNIGAGAAAGAMSLVVVYPLDYARTRLAATARSSAGEEQFKGLFDVFGKTYRADGIQGLYRGFGPSVVGIMVYRGFYFGLYDSLKPVVSVGPLQGSFITNFLLAWAGTTASGIAAYPFDTVRRRMMMTSGSGVFYKSSFDAFASIIKAQGVFSLFRGAGANVLRGIAGSGVLALYDLFQTKFFGRKW